jgi:hypothetical protein
MKKFINEKWLKVIVLIIFLITLTIFYFDFFVFNLHKKIIISSNANVKNTDQPKQPQDSTFNLEVNILLTSDGQEGDSLYADQYPKSIKIKTPEVFVDQINAYGASYHVWIAPKNWTGTGMEGADGNKRVDLYPANGSIKNGPHIEYYQAPACRFCMLDVAASFFTNAMNEYNQEYNQDGKYPVTMPQGLKIVRLSQTLVTYSLPDKEGLMVRGVVYYNEDDEENGPLAEAEFILPYKDADLLDFLLKYFINREGLK